jgi:hypothetical protein
MAKRSLSGEKSDFFQKNGLPLSLSLLLKEGIGNRSVLLGVFA